ncbi:lysosomal thioesterase PPT2-B isoform X1 [Hydra vulgaris]|uniref:lysosomal thioesterase PPT2-B isoform X1 n=1 Tax=Hydra vulgaris TaxID=6087 RepID=UPI001F5E9890|nr:lysosomal thioesterase PPT2-B isoform X1 [Hydra vulgaris]
MKTFILLLSAINAVACYKTVVLIHGVLSDASHMIDMKGIIEKHHPGTNIILLKLYPEIESFVPLPRQLRFWSEKLKPIMLNNPDGIHLICHSQGGLICLGIIEQFKDHNVHTLITLSSPLSGQFGVPAEMVQFIPWLNGTREALSKYMYTVIAQDTFAISNYWKDPREEYLHFYESYASYLPLIENNPRCKKVIHEEAIERKKNFLKLENLVLIGGPQDEVIKPWQSSLFGFFDSDLKVVDMANQTMFIEDWFGLRTLYERGKVYLFTIPNVRHEEWHGDENVFEIAMKKFLV